jgi:hypothetical protein
MEPILDRNTIWEKISELNSKLLFVKQLVNTIEENIKELTGVDISHLATKEELSAVEGSLKTFTNNAIQSLDISKYATKTHVEESITEAIEQIPEPEPPNLEFYLEKSEVFKDGDKTKNIEIGLNHAVPPTRSTEHSNVFIAGKTLSTDPTKNIANTVIGVGASCTNENGVCLGYNTKTSANYGIAIGYGASTAYSAAIALGPLAKANGTYSIAIGFGITNPNHYSIVIGGTTYTKCTLGPSSMVLSSSGITFNEQPKLLAGLTPTNATDIVHKQYVDGPIFKGNDIQIKGVIDDGCTDSMAIGYQTRVTGNSSLAIGSSVCTSGNNSVAIMMVPPHPNPPPDIPFSNLVVIGDNTVFLGALETNKVVFGVVGLEISWDDNSITFNRKGKTATITLA